MGASKWLFVLGLVPLFWAVLAFPQASGATTKEDNLYSMALKASITEMQKSWGHIDDGDHGSRIRTDYRHVVVRKSPEITDDLPSQFEDHHIEYLDWQTLMERCKSLRKEFAVLEVHPIHNEGTRLTIQVSVSWAKHQKNRLELGLSDWSNVEFLYDCEKESYIISAVKLGGI